MNTDRPALVIERLSTFFATPLETILRQRMTADPSFHALQLFKAAAAEVPAYRQFLQDRGIDPDSIADGEGFTSLPLLTKTGYMQKFPLPSRCKGGRLTACDRLAVSSGSTGIPTFWPRAMTDELDIALRFEHVFRHSFRADRRATLAVVCFPLGNWVGGLFTASCCWHLAQKGYPLTVATPGNKPDEILRVVRELGPFFEQTVLLGYPPFVKDVIDTGAAQGLDWPAFHIKFVFAGEVFSEEWRSLMLQRVGSISPCHDSASLYGTADGGVLGNETPLSIAIRRFLSAHPDVARELFGESRLPTLVQYDPVSRYFELIEGNTLAITGDNGVPLIRYHIADRGGLIGHDDLIAFLQARGLAALEDYGFEGEAFPLPFVWVFGRADFTVSFYGANIYPENVVVGLEQPELADRVSGKFVMEAKNDRSGSEFLCIAVELLPGVTADAGIEEAAASSVRAQLLRLNSEFANYVPPPKQIPRIELRPFGDPEYFPVGVKHRYTRRQTPT
ncbi:phenylacetate--CoA ligase family protein [Methylomicrobium sp. RS1]|uniref:phenylacetate--CoA ligase family protein n=1 Tax=Candidatus Methylomicrobium oryzae TaxID=2802053 RepID=UPI001921457C|nr:phenylacetate--CoA ligase family protein [Methylomicrobium sp. RS1]MBL1264422.1 phenylacetate--CoA ligase family protein [Methylomicrobium sp. RS1]